MCINTRGIDALFLIQYYNIYICIYIIQQLSKVHQRRRKASKFFLYNIIFRFDYNMHVSRTKPTGKNNYKKK